MNPGNPQPYAIAYSGHSGAAFFSIAGSFIADGNGNITSGTEDVNSGASGGSANTAIQASTYTVGPDGRTTANITTGMGTGVVWQFALVSNQHALMIRLDGNATGSGTIDQQNPIDFNSPFPLGNYAFGLSGMDAHSHATGVAGTLFANGNDTFPLGNGVLDLNDPGSSTTPTNVTDSMFRAASLRQIPPRDAELSRWIAHRLTRSWVRPPESPGHSNSFTTSSMRHT